MLLILFVFVVGSCEFKHYGGAILMRRNLSINGLFFSVMTSCVIANGTVYTQEKSNIKAVSKEVRFC